MIHLLSIGRLAPVTGLAENVVQMANAMPSATTTPIQELTDRAHVTVTPRPLADAHNIGQYRQKYREEYAGIVSEVETVIAKINGNVTIPWLHGNQKVVDSIYKEY